MSAAAKWHANPTHNGQAYNIGADDGANIALVYGPKDGGPEDFARVARLIVAAPVMLTALRKATDELNAIRARDGAPQHIDWHRGNPIQTDACTHEHWDALTEECFAAIDKASA